MADGLGLRPTQLCPLPSALWPAFYKPMAARKQWVSHSLGSLSSMQTAESPSGPSPHAVATSFPRAGAQGHPGTHRICFFPPRDHNPSGSDVSCLGKYSFRYLVSFLSYSTEKATSGPWSSFVGKPKSARGLFNPLYSYKSTAPYVTENLRPILRNHNEKSITPCLKRCRACCAQQTHRPLWTALSKRAPKSARTKHYGNSLRCSL